MYQRTVTIEYIIWLSILSVHFACCILSLKQALHIFIFFLLKHDYTIILYQLVSYACGYLYYVKILLQIGFDGVVMLCDNEACQSS